MHAPGSSSSLIDRLRAWLGAGDPWSRVRALVLVSIGWLLSPLCWWNDLVINLPLAWGVAKLLQFVDPAWFTPGLVVGYWLTNVAGILLMQFGAVEAIRSGDTARKPRRDLLIGLATSTVWTAAVFLLVKSGVEPFQIAGLSTAAPVG